MRHDTAAQPWTRQGTSLEATVYPMKHVKSCARPPALCSGEASPGWPTPWAGPEEVRRELHTSPLDGFKATEGSVPA